MNRGQLARNAEFRRESNPCVPPIAAIFALPAGTAEAAIKAFDELDAHDALCAANSRCLGACRQQRTCCAPAVLPAILQRDCSYSRVW